MGATTFHSCRVANSAEEAFRLLVQEAQWEHGHGVYTGTIAEKPGLVVSNPPDEVSPEQWVRMIQDYDFPENDTHSKLEGIASIYDDKWGDAVCSFSSRRWDHFVGVYWMGK